MVSYFLWCNILEITMQLVIRPFHKSDTFILMQIFHDAVHTVGSRYYSPEAVTAWAPMHTCTEAQKEADLERRCAKFAANITLVAECDAAIVGFADMTHEGYLDHVYVAPKYQARGIAYKLFKALEETAKQAGLTKITTHASMMAMPLAKRMGFKIVREETIMHRGVAIVRYEMEKELV